MEAFVQTTEEIRNHLQSLLGKALTTDDVSVLNELTSQQTVLLQHCLGLRAFESSDIEEARKLAMKNWRNNQDSQVVERAEETPQAPSLPVLPSMLPSAGNKENVPATLQRHKHNSNSNTNPVPPEGIVNLNSPASTTQTRMSEERTSEENNALFLHLLTTTNRALESNANSEPIICCSSLFIEIIKIIHATFHKPSTSLLCLSNLLNTVLEATETMRDLAGQQKIVDDDRRTSAAATSAPTNFNCSGANVQKQIDATIAKLERDENDKQARSKKVAGAKAVVKAAVKAMKKHCALNAKKKDSDPSKDLTLHLHRGSTRITTTQCHSLLKTTTPTSLVTSLLITIINIVHVMEQLLLRHILPEEALDIARSIASDNEFDFENQSVADFMQDIVKPLIEDASKELLILLRDIEIALADLKDNNFVHEAFRNIEHQTWRDNFLLLDDNPSALEDYKRRNQGESNPVGYFTDDPSGRVTRAERSLRVFFAHLMSIPMVKYYDSIEKDNMMNRKLYFISPTDIIKNFSVKFLTKEMTISNKQPCQRRLVDATNAYKRRFPPLQNLVQFVSTTSLVSFTKESLACKHLLSNNY